MGKYRQNKHGGLYSDNVTTPVGRIFWMSVVTPKEYTGPVAEGKAKPDLKFEANICFKKDDPKTIAFKQKLEELSTSMITEFNTGKKQQLGACQVLQDGDTLDTDKYPWLAGCYFMVARSARKPGCVARDPNEIIDNAILQGGMLGKLNFQGTVSNFGFSYSLAGLQMWEDDSTRFGGAGMSPTNLFAACGDEEETPVTAKVEAPPVVNAVVAEVPKAAKGKGAIANLL